MPETNHHENHERDPALEPIGRALEGRAEALRREPDESFEARVLDASRVALRTGAALRLVEGRRDDAPKPARVTGLPLFRIAASVAVLLTAGAIALLASRQPNVVAPPDRIADAGSADFLDELDSWLAMADAHFADARLVTLRAEVDSALTTEPASVDIFDVEEWM